MTRRNTEKTKLSARLFSGFFFLIGLVVLVAIGISLGKETYRKRQIQKEIEILQSQIEKVAQENNQMEDLIAYLSSKEFQEKEAREKLNLQKEDEKMVVLRKDSIQPGESMEKNADNAQAAQEDNTPNWKKWWNFFFVSKS